MRLSATTLPTDMSLCNRRPPCTLGPEDNIEFDPGNFTSVRSTVEVFPALIRLGEGASRTGLSAVKSLTGFN
jgi:hypothetical protein